MEQIVILVLLVGALGFLASKAIEANFQARLQRERQKELAYAAPQLLTQHDISAPVAAVIVEQRKILDEAARIMQAVIDDNGVMIDADHSYAIETWLIRKGEFLHES
jgi:hypothetical protein